MLRQTKSLKHGLKFLIVYSLLSLTFNCYANEWQTLAPGIQYRDLNSTFFNPWSHIHVFQIDLEYNELDLVLAKQLSRKYASIDEFAEKSKALIAINGGFFDKNHHPLGLRISERRQKNPLKRISWWGIFYVKGETPYLSSLKHFKVDERVDFALQSGPRLLVNGKIPSLKPGVAERSALGITRDKKVIVLVTDGSPMTTFALAQIMKSPPLNCIDALNLDGGNSSQLKANIDSFELNVHGFSNVSDAIVVKSRPT